MSRNTLLFVLCFGLLLICAAPLVQADVLLNEVVVTATKTEKKSQDLTQSVTVITADDIAKSGATSVAEVISTTAGVTETDQGSLGSLQAITLRGSSYQQVLVLLDGKRLNSASAGGFDFSELPVPLSAVERIEIVRGPSSSLYGADAVGGVINIITKTPSTQQTTLNMGLGRAGYTAFSLYTSGRENNVYYALSAGKERSHGYVNNSDSDKMLAGLKVGNALNNVSSIEATVDYTTKDIGVPGSSLYGFTPQARQQNRLLISGIQFKDRLSQIIDFRARAYGSEEFLGYQDPDFGVNSRSRVKTMGAEAQTNLITGTWNVITIGVDGREDRLEDIDFGSHSATVSAAYIQDEMSLGESFILVLGERQDRHSTFGSKSSPKASARYLISGSGTIIRASYGESFRAPTFNDLYFRDSYGDTGNPNLKPESAKEYEGGIEQSLGSTGSAKVTLFERKVKDLILWRTDIFPTYPDNVGQARISGYEAETKFTLFKAVLFSLNYSRMFPVDETTGERLFTDSSHIPDTVWGGSLKYALDKETALSLDGRRVVNYVKPGDEAWDYFVMNGKISKKVLVGKNQQITYFVGVKNIFNRRYETVKGYTMPPQELYGGIEAQF